MRLVCPNCDAEYEVDDAAIPKGGRDVQCSNCGHAWYQNHPEVEAEQEAEEDLYEPPAGAAASVPMAEAPVPDSVAEPEAEPEVEVAASAEPALVPFGDPTPPSSDTALIADPEDTPPPVITTAPQRSLDETVLAVLREEAERESAARKAEAAHQPVIETQTEMPLAARRWHGCCCATDCPVARHGT